jgi:hypothetical protein
VGSGWLGLGLSHDLDCHIYLVNGGTELAFIDEGVGLEVERIVNNIRADGLDPGKLKSVLLTHAHADHAGGCKFWKERFGVHVFGSSEAARFVNAGEEAGISLAAAKAGEFYPADYHFQACPVHGTRPPHYGGYRRNAMNRREFLAHSAFSTFLLANPWGDGSATQGLEIERGAPTPEAVSEPQFPDRLHLFIWRNWELANADRMAKVLGTTPEKVLAIGAAMGLPPKPTLTEDQLRRMYITAIRQNWHILPDNQLLQLLGWDQQQYEYTLKEDDFLWIKLGRLKPRCDRLRYEEPSDATRRREAEIKRLIQEVFGTTIEDPGEPAFQFVADLSSTHTPSMRDPHQKLADEEVDLAEGWVLREPDEGSGIPLQLAQEFRAYLQSAFGAKVDLAESRGEGSNVVEMALDPAIAQAVGGFEVSVKPEAVRIVGRDLAGLRQGIYYLQDQMEKRGGPYLPKGFVVRTSRLDPRYVYSYFALYGDPLMEADINPFPDGFLEKLARVGVNGVWLQAVLRALAPSKIFPEFGDGWETRLKNLSMLVDRAQNHGIKIYLYLNEPRAMPAEFFAKHPGIKGTYDRSDPQFFAMCTSTTEVREWISETLEHIFSQVPKLGGVFSITASENLTNCYSHGRAQLCPRCSKRSGAEVVAEVIQTFRDGVRRSSREAAVIAWDWGWGGNDGVLNGPDTSGVIERLPKDTALLSVSEWDQPVDRGGFHTKVGEYSISVVGPGPRAVCNWHQARERGLTTLAKVQFNNTWEISAVPYIPVPNLIVRHCENLLNANVQGLMLSWTVGGYPSPNLRAAKQFYFSPASKADEALREVAEERYGKQATPGILDAWTVFSRAFEEFPYGVAIYTIPTQHGPANPLRLHPTGFRAAMILFPYDDYEAWIGPYPVEIVEKQFEKMARMWETGVETFRKTLPRVPSHKEARARKDLGVAETCYLHFESVANQIRFYNLRARWQSSKPQDRAAIAARMIKTAEEEMQLARRQYAIVRRDSAIAYEASNQYYYRPLDLVEKVLNCQQVIEELKKV